MNRRVAVTGSAGFIGQHLVRALSEAGYEVIGIDTTSPRGTPQGTVHRCCDLLDPQAIARTLSDEKPDLLVHLAARTDLDEEGGIEGYAVNTDGVRNLMHAIKGAEHIRRAICVSSQLVCDLGYQPKSDTDFRPTTTYGRSKVLTEQIWRDADGGGVEWCIVRPTTVWGPGMGDHYQRFFRMISDGHYVHVGRAQVTKSYGYVGNTVYQIWRLLQAPAHDICGKVFYLADYEPIALQAWADEFQERMAAPPIRRIPLWAAKMVAIAGDFLNQVGFSRCPFNTFRLANVLTSFQVDTANLEALCGPLPYTAKLGAAETVAWLNDLWLPDDEGTTT